MLAPLTAFVRRMTGITELAASCLHGILVLRKGGQAGNFSSLQTSEPPMSRPMIIIQVRYFASLRETLGASEEVSVGEGSTIGDLRMALVARGGRHAEMLDSRRPVRSAVNLAMCDECAVLGEGCKVAFFPPVTGG